MADIRMLAKFIFENCRTRSLVGKKDEDRWFHFSKCPESSVVLMHQVFTGA